MRMQLKSSSCVVLALLAAFSILAFNRSVVASVWNTNSGDYNTAGNWSGGVPNGASAIADFSQVDLVGDASIVLDTDVTLGQLLFGDTNLGSAGSWELRTNIAPIPIITFDNGANKPVIRVNTLTPTTFDDAFIGHSLAGTNGFSKVGAGIATLGTGTVNTITGGINIDEGTLRLRGAIPLGQSITLANGTTLDSSVSVRMTPIPANAINVASGATATFIASAGTVDFGSLNASGATLNLIAPVGNTLRANDNWATNGSPAAVNISGGGAFSFRSNGGGYAATSLQNTAVNLDGSLIWLRSSSGGNTISMGSLSGNSSAILSGGGQGGGTFATYLIGGLNTDTEFAGTIDTTSAPTPNSATDQGGVNLTKVGTGTLTLSGTLTYQPTGNGTVNRRGGITTVSAGTLKLTNTAAIPGGIVHGTVGNVLSTVNIASGATLDVSGFSGTYSTAPLQQIVGGGTVVGNFTHDEGVIRPANTISGTTASGTTPSVAASGPITFANNFTWSGGDYTYDTTLDPLTSTDRINVTGTATLTSGTITPNFPAGIPATGTYTVLNAGAISGAATNITISWPGRSADPVPFITGTSLQFNAPGISSASLVWTGANGTNPTFWDVETTVNWTGGSPPTFFQSDNVTFNDTASSFAVAIQAPVQPTSVTVNNSSNDYTISGTNGIGGAATFTKTGTAKLTMTTANSFTGAASIADSTVEIGAANGALGTGALTMTNAHLIIANTATAGLTNSSLASAGTSNTIEVNGAAVSPLSLPVLSGTADLTITSNTFIANVGKNVDIGAVSGFTGDLNLIGATDLDGVDPVTTVNTTVFRVNSSGSDLSTSAVSLTNGASLRDRATSVQTLSLGSLTGDATATLWGYQGGSGATARTWRIGDLNTSTTFAGVIQNGAGSASTTAATNIVKTGTGTLTLTGVNIYTGNTSVEAGTLSINNPYLADAADVLLTTGSVFNLNFGSLSTIDTIDELLFNGIGQATGTWGRIGSGAAHESAFFTGDGLLSVTTFTPPPTPTGDYDLDGDVDGRDFLVWQRGGSPTPLSAGDLAAWQANYGMPIPPLSAATSVPEPCAGMLAFGFGLALVGLRKRGR